MIRSRYTAAITDHKWRGTSDWWTANGAIDPVNCIAAYEPKNAPDYQKSLTNIANPGVHDLSALVPPLHDPKVGWTFGSNRILMSDITMDLFEHGGSMIMRYSDQNTSLYTNPVGSIDTAAGEVRCMSIVLRGTVRFYAGHTGTSDTGISVVPTTVSVVGITMTSGSVGYLWADGTKWTDQTIPNSTITTNAYPIGIGGRNIDGTYTATNIINIPAIAFYKIDITDAYSILNSLVTAL